MRFCVLGSGSRGNAVLVESGSTAVLLDAGFSGKEIRRRLALIGRAPEHLAAILLSHEHGDHISGAGVLSRQLRLPVYANVGTHRAAECRLHDLHQRAEFETGSAFTLHDLQVHPFRVSHDCADPVGFVVSDGEKSLCCCTDTGKITALIQQRAQGCQALILEANYDSQMLADGPYPLPVKQRVRSNQGHLANDDAARFLAGLTGSPLRQAVLAHLSSTNNLPELVQARMNEEIGTLNSSFRVDIAGQDAPTQLYSL